MWQWVKCIRYKKHIENKSPKDERIMFLANCAVCNNKKNKIFKKKKQKAQGLLSLIGKMRILGLLLIWYLIYKRD